MRRRIPVAVAAAAVALACGFLVTAPMASAEVVTPEAFAAQIKAALDTSGVFARATTLVTQQRTREQNGDGYVTTLARVNADGSLTYHQTDSGGVLDVRCVRRNVCWQRPAGARGDGRWHVLPRGAVGYDPASVDLWGPFVRAMPPGSVFDVSPAADGQQVFAITIPSGSLAGTMTWAVSAGRTTIVLTSIDAQGVSSETTRVVYRALARPVRVTAPAATAIGRPNLRVSVPVIVVSYNGK